MDQNQSGGEWEFYDAEITDDWWDGDGVDWVRLYFKRGDFRIHIDYNVCPEVREEYGPNDVYIEDGPTNDDVRRLEKELFKPYGIDELIKQYEPIAKLYL